MFSCVQSALNISFVLEALAHCSRAEPILLLVQGMSLIGAPQHNLDGTSNSCYVLPFPSGYQHNHCLQLPQNGKLIHRYQPLKYDASGPRAFHNGQGHAPIALSVPGVLQGYADLAFDGLEGCLARLLSKMEEFVSI